MFCYVKCILLSAFSFSIAGAAKDTSAVVGSLLTEFCVAELEEVSGEVASLHHFNATGFGVGLGFPQPIVQESSHPYTDDVTLTGNIHTLIIIPWIYPTCYE